MAEETGRELNEAIAAGVAPRPRARSGRCRASRGAPARERGRQPRRRAARLKIPVTVHVGIGTDIIHMHSAASGEAIGAGSLRDFRYFTSFVSALAGGRVPQLRLRRAAARGVPQGRGARPQQRISLDGLTTVNLDFARLYRPETNVVRRPVAGIGKGYSITGHHELLIPLLAAAVVAADKGQSKLEVRS